MNFQEKVFESTADFRARTAKGVQILKTSLSALQVAGRELNKVARRHVSRFVKENLGVAIEAGKDVRALARSTYAQLAGVEVKPVRKARKAASPRKRAAKAA
jgi:hypothetical protein